MAPIRAGPIHRAKGHIGRVKYTQPILYAYTYQCRHLGIPTMSTVQKFHGAHNSLPLSHTVRSSMRRVSPGFFGLPTAYYVVAMLL